MKKLAIFMIAVMACLTSTLALAHQNHEAMSLSEGLLHSVLHQQTVMDYLLLLCVLGGVAVLLTVKRKV